MAETVVIDLDQDIIDGAVRKIGQKYRVAQVVFAQQVDRDVTRTGVTFGTRWLGTDGKSHAEPPIADLPVLWPRGNGYGIHCDLADGDLGLAVACDGPVRGIFENGGVVTPQFVQGHEWGCAVVLPGGRVSSSVVPTPPPNTAGTMLLGAEDGTAAVVLARAGGPTPAELGTVAMRAANPAGGVLLGTDDPALATLGAARLTDPVAASTELGTVLTALVAFANGIAPSTVTPPQLAAALAKIGIISGASAKVMMEPSP